MRRFVLAALLCLTIGGFGALFALAVDPAPAPARYRFVPPREPAFDFALSDQDGDVRTLRAARGKVVALTFLYSTCHDLCPAEAVLIGAAAEKAGGGVMIYSISVDPDGDTPARAKDFIRLRSLDPKTFRFLLGSREQLARVWRAYGIAPVNATPEEAIAAAKQADEYRAAMAKAPPQKRPPYEPPKRPAPEDANDAYPDPGDLSYRGRSRHEAGLDFEHSAYVMLIDKHGRQRVGVPFEHITVDGLAADFEALLREP